MTIAEAAIKLGMSPKTVRKLMKDGKLPIGLIETTGERVQFFIFSKWVDRFLEGDPVQIDFGKEET